ncbi:MAG: F0F1-type ATP synthase assembly protein I [Crocinitomicaceae bacterium]|jgi:hypothetical protein
MIKKAIGFILLLTALLGFAFVIHALLQHDLKIGAFESHIVINYCFNYFFTIAFFIVLLVYERRKSDLLGFVFLAASTIKLILFLIILYPYIKEGEGLRSVEFASFFVPYGISVVIEILYLLRILNSKDAQLG